MPFFRRTGQSINKSGMQLLLRTESYGVKASNNRSTYQLPIQIHTYACRQKQITRTHIYTKYSHPAYTSVHIYISSFIDNVVFRINGCIQSETIWLKLYIIIITNNKCPFQVKQNFFGDSFLNKAYFSFYLSSSSLHAYHCYILYPALFTIVVHR